MHGSPDVVFAVSAVVCLLGLALFRHRRRLAGMSDHLGQYLNVELLLFGPFGPSVIAPTALAFLGVGMVGMILAFGRAFAWF